jgi:hypothetical protein
MPQLSQWKHFIRFDYLRLPKKFAQKRQISLYCRVKEFLCPIGMPDSQADSCNCSGTASSERSQALDGRQAIKDARHP